MIGREGVTSIVIAGATGDLAQRKLLPALFHLWCKGRLPDNVCIVGFSRTEFSDDGFRDRSFRPPHGMTTELVT